ncbi:MAG TPA: cysteine hydrolase family protein, partial [Microvirga sp.]|nr:cysteine hydrolase family protein [Microvirga sp.]
AALLDRARENGVPIIHVQHEDDPGDVLARDTEGWRFHPRVAPLTGEPVIGKRYCSAFQGTDLNERLSALGVDTIAVAGLQTQFCVDTACRVAATLGYRVVLAADAHTTVDTPLLAAAQIIAHHNSTLRTFASIRPAAEIEFGDGRG